MLSLHGLAPEDTLMAQQYKNVPARQPALPWDTGDNPFTEYQWFEPADDRLPQSESVPPLRDFPPLREGISPEQWERIRQEMRDEKFREELKMRMLRMRLG